MRLRDNRFEASTFSSLAVPQKIFTGAEISSLAELFRLPADGEFGWSVFREKATEVAGALTKLKLEKRQAMQKRLQAALGQQGGIAGNLSNGERLQLGKLALRLGAKKPASSDLLDIILDIRRVAIKARPGLALVLGDTLLVQNNPEMELGVLDEDDMTRLESNEISGILSLYGMPASEDSLSELRKLFNNEYSEKLAIAGLLGSLSLQGNQLLRLTVSELVVKQLIDQLQTTATGEGKSLALFARCLLSDNVIEGDANTLVTHHLTLNANAFSLTAARALPFATTHVPRHNLGTMIADSSIYTSNHAQRTSVLIDISRSNQEIANLNLEIK